MITITIYKNYKLILMFTDWFIWPVWKRNWDVTYSSEQIEVAFDTGSLDRPVGSHYIPLHAQTDFYIWFLFFKFHFPKWHTFEDVASIYPANYNWKDDPDYDKKYQQLANSGYFA